MYKNSGNVFPLYTFDIVALNNQNLRADADRSTGSEVCAFLEKSPISWRNRDCRKIHDYAVNGSMYRPFIAHYSIPHLIILFLIVIVNGSVTIYSNNSL